MFHIASSEILSIDRKYLISVEDIATCKNLIVFYVSRKVLTSKTECKQDKIDYALFTILIFLFVMTIRLRDMYNNTLVVISVYMHHNKYKENQRLVIFLYNLPL